MPDDAIERARQAAADLRLMLGSKGITLTDDARTAINQAFLAFASQQAPEGWRPIDTAPKDGTEFQAWVRDAKLGSQWWEYRCRINSASEAFEIWDRIDYDEDGFEAYPHIEPTHWMPPPAPPAMLDAAPSVTLGEVG